MPIFSIAGLEQEEVDLLLSAIMRVPRVVGSLRSYSAFALLTPQASLHSCATPLLAYSIDLSATIISGSNSAAPVSLTMPPLPHYLLGSVKYPTAISCISFTFLSIFTDPVLILGLNNGAWAVLSINGDLLFPYVGGTNTQLVATAEPIVDIITPESYELPTAFQVTLRQYSRVLHIRCRDLEDAIERNIKAPGFDPCPLKDAGLETSQLPVSIHDDKPCSIDLLDSFDPLDADAQALTGRLRIRHGHSSYTYSDAVSYTLVDLTLFDQSCNLCLKEPRIVSVPPRSAHERDSNRTNTGVSTTSDELLTYPLSINNLVMDGGQHIFIGPRPFVVRISPITTEIGTMAMPRAFLDTVAATALTLDQTFFLDSTIYQVEVRGCVPGLGPGPDTVYTAQYIGGSLVDQIGYSVGHIRGDFNTAAPDCAHDTDICLEAEDVSPDTCSAVSDLALFIRERWESKRSTPSGSDSAPADAPGAGSATNHVSKLPTSVKGIYGSYYRVPFGVWADDANVPYLVALSSENQLLCVNLHSFDVCSSIFLPQTTDATPAVSNQSVKEKQYRFTLAIAKGGKEKASGKVYVLGSTWSGKLVDKGSAHMWAFALPDLKLVNERQTTSNCLVQVQDSVFCVDVVPCGSLYSLDWSLVKE